MINVDFVRQVGALRWARRYARRQFEKRVLNRDTTMTLPTGSPIILPKWSKSATEVYVTEANMDWGSEALLSRFADKNYDFIDVGAHIGFYSLYISPLARRVYAFEPDPRVLSGLRMNAGLVANVTIVPMAVSSRPGHCQFDIGRDIGLGTLEPEGAETVTVATTTIDAFLNCNQHIRPNLVKTDAEGHDLEVLRGMRGSVERFQPLILSETGMSEALNGLMREWCYAAFAYTRAAPGAKARLSELVPERRPDALYKMIFLVPSRLRPDFARLVAG